MQIYKVKFQTIFSYIQQTSFNCTKRITDTMRQLLDQVVPWNMRVHCSSRPTESVKDRQTDRWHRKDPCVHLLMHAAQFIICLNVVSNVNLLYAYLSLINAVLGGNIFSISTCHQVILMLKVFCFIAPDVTCGIFKAR